MNKDMLATIERFNFVVLDTETTGLEKPAELVSIAIVDPTGVVLLDTMLKPKRPIPPAATAIHGITDFDVFNSPEWPLVKSEVMRLIYGKDVIVYNAVYDRKVMHWTDEAWGLEQTDYKQHADWHCAMQAYAEYHGETHPYYGTYVWQKLSAACEQMNVTGLPWHSALSDAMATLYLLRACTPAVLWPPLSAAPQPLP